MRVDHSVLPMLLLCATGLAMGAPPGAGPSVDRGPTLLRSDDAEVSVRVVFDSPRIANVGTGPGRTRDVTVSGLPRQRIVGEPALPYRSVLVTIPPGSAVRLEVDDPQPTPLTGLRPATFESPAGAEGRLAMATDPSRSRPFGSVEIDFDGFLRGRRVVRLVFYPLTLDPTGRGTIYHPQLTARLLLGPTPSGRVFRASSEGLGRRTEAESRDAPTVGHPLSGRTESVEQLERTLYTRTILNEHTVDEQAYRSAISSTRESSESSRTPENASSLDTLTYRTLSSSAPLPAKIPVRSEDIWTVFHADLLATGLDAGGTPTTALSLTSGGSPLPLRVFDGGDGTFDSGDRVEFYGTGIEGEIEYDTNVYRLAFDEGPGMPTTTRNATPSGGASPPSFVDMIRFEENLVFFTTRADSDDDRIGWERVIGTSMGSAATSYDFVLPDVDPAAATIRIRARVYDLGGAHTTSLLLNGVDLMDSLSWSAGDVTHDVTTSATNLVPGTNTLTLQLAGSSNNQVIFNWFEVEYSRLFRAENDRLAFTSDLAPPVAHQISGFTTADVVVYDITDPTAPVLLEGVQISGTPGDYSANFTDTLGGSRRFLGRAGSRSSAGPLLPDHPSALRESSNGADLIVLSYRDFVDEMIPLVNARQAQGWRVILVDLEDAFDEYTFGRPDPAAIRTFLADAYSNWQPPAPAFVLLVGNATLDPRQLLPESVPPLMPTGRFIAPTLGLAASDNALVTIVGDDPLPDLFVGRIPAQTEDQVADTVAKILAYDDVAPSLLNQSVLLAADDDDLSFETVQEDLASVYLSNTRLPAERAYLRLLGISGTNQKIRNTINQGTLATNFLGHGNIHNWAAENVLVDSSDIPLLTNSDRPTFLTTLNCINGFHAGPRGSSLDSLAEQALLANNGGAIGVWSPSALALFSDYSRISEILYRQLFVDREQRLGVATTLAKVEAYTVFGTSVANLDEMHLFGDPTTVLRVDGDLDDLIDFEEDQSGLEPRDADSDDDGLNDGAEAMPFADADGDGRPNALDPDADDDGLPDGLESGIVTPGPDTDPDRGTFTPDADPTSTTDPNDGDTDGGGAPDGAEDRNANGLFDAGETDPQNPADDPSCAVGPAVEISGLMLTKNGADAGLSWVDQSPDDPCVLYRVHVATNALSSDAAAFVVETTTTLSGWNHDKVIEDANVYFYLVTSTSPIAGEGPLGHYGQ